MKTRFTKVVALSLAVFLLFGAVCIPASAASKTEDSYQDILASLTADPYSDYLAGAKNDGATKGAQEIVYDVDALVNLIDPDKEKTNAAYEVKTQTVTDLKDPYNPVVSDQKFLVLPDVGQVTWKFNFTEEQAGLYGIRIEYAPVDGSTASVERKLLIDGVVPFDEARAFSMTSISPWRSPMNFSTP